MNRLLRLYQAAPTRVPEWRRMAVAVGDAVTTPAGALAAVVSGIAYVSLFALPGNLSTLSVLLTSSLPVGRKATVLLGVYPPFSPVYSLVDTAFIALLGALVGANAAVLVQLRQTRQSGETGTATGIGVVGGILGSGCAACGSVVVPLAGVSTAVAALPLGGLELSIGSAVGLILVLSFATEARSSESRDRCTDQSW